MLEKIIAENTTTYSADEIGQILAECEYALDQDELLFDHLLFGYGICPWHIQPGDWIPAKIIANNLRASRVWKERTLLKALGFSIRAIPTVLLSFVLGSCIAVCLASDAFAAGHDAPSSERGLQLLFLLISGLCLFAAGYVYAKSEERQ